MSLEDWLIEHIIEIITLLVMLLGFERAIGSVKNLNVKQKAKLSRSPHSNIIQMAHVGSVNIPSFKRELEKEEITSQEYSCAPTKEIKKAANDNEEAKDILNKIEDYIDQQKDTSVIAKMCLRLAKILKMECDVDWLTKEVCGFFQDSDSSDGLEEKSNLGQDYKNYRRVRFDLNIGYKNLQKIDTLPIKIFISQPLETIESWVENKDSSDIFLLKAAPMQTMINILHVDPNDKVPYTTNVQSIRHILIGARIELGKFTERARSKIQEVGKDEIERKKD